MVDKNYCMSSYMAFRYIEDKDKDFYPTGGDIVILSPSQRGSVSL